MPTDLDAVHLEDEAALLPTGDPGQRAGLGALCVEWGRGETTPGGDPGDKQSLLPRAGTVQQGGVTAC